MRPVFSTPAFRYRGLKIGSEKADARFALTVNKFLIANIGDGAGTCQISEAARSKGKSQWFRMR